MVSVISGKRQLENGDCSLPLSPPVYKMQKVSAVRDFAFGFGPYAALMNVHAKEAEGSGLKGVGDLSKDVDYRDGNGPDDVERKGVLGAVVESQSHDTAFCSESSEKVISSLVKYKNTEHGSEHFPVLPVVLRSNRLSDEFINKNPNLSQNVTQKIEESMLIYKIHDRSKDLVDVRVELTEQTYPPRKTVYVHDFPSGYGCNVGLLGEEEDKHFDQEEANSGTYNMVIRNDEHQAGLDFDTDIASRDQVKGITFGEVEEKNEGQSDEGACRVMITPAFPNGKYSEMKEHEQVPEAKSDGQRGGLMEDVVYYGKDEKDEKALKKEAPIIVPCSSIGSQERMPCIQNEENRVVVLCLMSAPNCPWKQGREVNSSRPSTNAKRKKGKKQYNAKRSKHKRSPNKGKDSIVNLREITTAHLNETDINDFPGVSRGEAYSSEDEELSNDFLSVPRKCDIDVSLPPVGVVSSSERGIRSKVRETLRLFHAIVRKLQQRQEAKSKDKENAVKFLAAKILKDQGKYINSSKKSIQGPVPGIEVGDLFRFRIELAIVGLHRPLQSGIDTLNLGQTTIATSIVASGGYANDMDSSDVLIYTGQGGNVSGDKQPEDQKLERGNLALKNSVKEKNVVRVIRGFKEKNFATYTYDGLYTVERYWPDIGPHGKLVYKFELRRCPGQPELSWKEVTRSKNSKVREGLCVHDISGGKETVPICAFNTLDDEKPPSFTYITSMMYPDWCQPIPPRGCDCKDDCSDSERCACAVKNGGEIPYNYDGAIIEAKPLVYECGPSCKCRSTCHNRVSQHGIKFPLEIFKTESRGWGLRCLSSIPSGSFICEYIGELLDDKEAEQRAGSDEYLFDIGRNYSDPTLWDGPSGLKPDVPSSSIDIVDNVGFTIDAAEYGNIGRFINHSCSPNLYAQNVVYDHEDNRIPHIMLFAAENIPPLQELTYHYNYAIDQVLDSNGNVKKKNCYCGSSECTGRMY